MHFSFLTHFPSSSSILLFSSSVQSERIKPHLCGPSWVSKTHYNQGVKQATIKSGSWRPSACIIITRCLTMVSERSVGLCEVWVGSMTGLDMTWLICLRWFGGLGASCCAQVSSKGHILDIRMGYSFVCLRYLHDRCYTGLFQPMVGWYKQTQPLL